MKLLLLFIISSLYLNASLVRGTNTVQDTKNKLIWQDTQENIYLRLNYEEAIEYCENLSLLGKTSWRLPSREEFKLIIDKSRKDENMINKAFKFNMPDEYYTGETTWRSLGRYAYYVFFKSGSIYYNNKKYKRFVRCVH